MDVAGRTGTASARMPSYFGSYDERRRSRAAPRRSSPASAARPRDRLSNGHRRSRCAPSPGRAAVFRPASFWPFSCVLRSPPAPSSDCRSRSIRSTTSACRGSTCAASFGFLALQLRLDDLHQVRAVLVGVLRRIPRVREVLDERARHLQLRLADVLRRRERELARCRPAPRRTASASGPSHRRSLRARPGAARRAGRWWRCRRRPVSRMASRSRA